MAVVMVWVVVMGVGGMVVITLEACSHTCGGLSGTSALPIQCHSWTGLRGPALCSQARC